MGEVVEVAAPQVRERRAASRDLVARNSRS